MGLFDFFKKKDEAAADTEADTSAETSDREAELRAARAAIDKLRKNTLTDCARLELTETKPAIFESKIGGAGYVPHEGDIPQDKNGRQLRLLAQIDCSQVKLKDLPESGLLQFWILNDDLWGLSFEDNTRQDTFRVIYHKDVDKSVTEDEVKAKLKKNEFDDKNIMPVKGEYGLKFTLESNAMSSYDARFEKIFCEYYNAAQPPKQIGSFADLDIDPYEIAGYEKLCEEAFGHKIGGYPAFTQYDPREADTGHDFLLLQLDSEEIRRIMWGDSGICGFFINREKLKELDFSDVIYNWDCY